ncbi:MAG: MlaD family protein [Deferrisomatales bacterium]
MSTRANPRLIGAFVLGATTLLIGVLMFLGRAQIWTPTREFVLFFDGAVTGLQEGAPVVFRGVPVGRVKEILLECDLADLTLRVPVVIELEPRRVRVVGGDLESNDVLLLVDRGLRAQLELQSVVTGQLMISFDFYPDTPATTSGLDRGMPELPTIPNRLQRLSRAIERLPLDEIVDRTARALESIEKVANSDGLRDGAQSLQELVAEATLLLRRLNERIGPLTDGVQETLGEVRSLSRRWDGYGARVTESVETAAADASGLFATVETRVRDVGGELAEVLVEGRTVLRATNERVGPAADSVNRAAEQTRSFFARMDRDVPPVLERLNAAVRTAQDTLEQARRAAAAAEDVLGEDTTLRYQLSEALREVAAAARSVRNLADTLEQQPDALLRGKAGSGPQ